MLISLEVVEIFFNLKGRGAYEEYFYHSEKSRKIIENSFFFQLVIYICGVF